ncbi:hypothetical protein AJ79_03901 [Helicocarpus griseus UAMH5409]|uniref:Aminoglycoside phosphotransferase domain-containing protein n=1 Tax=Helicocarpus griseus UAMH5409 TaxID=1447875 RepID=A0A2B7XMR1_9EURO|nr:hypothetical protein AJ79_03901 [Helicocarpus griseus UAMH5409]
MELIKKENNPVLFERLQQVALEAFEAGRVRCSFMGCDVDMTVRPNGEVFAVEINPQPASFLQESKWTDLPIIESLPGGFTEVVNIFIANWFLHKGTKVEMRNKIADTYTGFSSKYNTYVEASELYNIMKKVAEEFDFGGVVFDLGCGTGLFGRALHEAQQPDSSIVSRIIGFDTSSGMADICRESGFYEQVYHRPMETALLNTLSCLSTSYDSVDHVVGCSALQFLSHEEFAFLLVMCFRMAKRSITVVLDEITDACNERLVKTGEPHMCAMNHLEHMLPFGQPSEWRLRKHERLFSWKSPATGEDIYTNVFRYERIEGVNSKTAIDTDLFSYTSGRFILNEQIRLRERYVKFNVEALKHLAANHTESGQHGKVVRFTKLAEGGFNRVFLLDMEDVFQAIAKIPYLIAGPKHYATASEAATLYFLHARGVPVPKVYGYSSTSENPVGTEYIIMEKAKGVGLQSKWLTMAKKERHRLASSFVETEMNFLTSLSVQPEKEGSGMSKELCIGPIADYMFWYGKRSGLDFYRGPWDDPKDYLRAIATKEIECTRKHGNPVEVDFPHNGILPGKQDPQKYIDLLESYATISPHLLPKDLLSPSNKPTLRHPDLNPNNIFVDPESGAISCIIDWQHAIIKPRLLASGYPPAFENPDTELSLELKEPTLPSDYGTLSTEEKSQAYELYRRQLTFYYLLLLPHL